MNLNNYVISQSFIGCVCVCGGGDGVKGGDVDFVQQKFRVILKSRAGIINVP